VAPDERLRVRGRRDRDVAALAVGDDEQARGPGALDDLAQGRPAGRAEPLEARELRLDGDARRTGRLDQRRAVRRHRRGRSLRRVPRGGRGLDRARPQAGRVGVEAEHEL
jgi:hypothetical protein